MDQDRSHKLCDNRQIAKYEHTICIKQFFFFKKREKEKTIFTKGKFDSRTPLSLLCPPPKLVRNYKFADQKLFLINIKIILGKRIQHIGVLE